MSMHKVVINARFGGFSLSNKALKYLKDTFNYETDTYSDMERHDPRLVETVEALGEEAGGKFAKLHVETIAGNLYQIEEYDGYENVITPEIQEWIIIEEEV